MQIRNISISDYTYALPEEKIARYPLAERDISKLLVYKNENITEDIYRNIGHYIPPESLLVFNNTKVVEARLMFQKPSGGVIEIFCLEPGNQYADVTTGMAQQSSVQWKCLIGGASKWKPGQVLQKIIERNDGSIILEARYIEKQNDAFVVELSWTPAHLSFADILHLTGHIPLPPYIKRAAENSDAERYQTTYALHDGSVAAPTAGLHFTPAVFATLQEKNIRSLFVTLHVGAGTFKPVKSATMEGHDMHAEFIDVSKENISDLLSYEGKTYAVGTTSARTLESLYWLGVKTILCPEILLQELTITQWEIYDELEKHGIAFNDALQSLLEWMDRNKTNRLITKTQLLIAPGYRFRVIEGLVTNFHQPQSTLLLLVAALIGPAWKKLYSYALDHDFRFLSYGDGCLLLPSTKLCL